MISSAPSPSTSPTERLCILTDLMERTVAITGTLQTANLVEGVVIVKESA